jgi:6-phosphogluconate dehydrogenase
MRFGLIGLGRMGAGVAKNALDHGHEVVGVDPQAAQALAADGLEPADGLEDLARRLEPPRTIVLWVPHGDPTEEVCRALRPLLDAGDLVVDGGNSHWEDSKRRHAFFAETDVAFLDVGTSGGVSGAREGACFMAGGDADAFARIEPLLTDLAVDPRGVVHAGPPGAGHFAKLIHNGIEFGMIQAIAEGVEMLERSEFPLDLPALFDNWMHGSVIRSWLVELMGQALAENPGRADLSTYVEDTDEVKWVLEWAMREDIPTPVTADAQQLLMQYRDLESPQAKAVALLRHGFGGHPVHRRGDEPPRG